MRLTLIDPKETVTHGHDPADKPVPLLDRVVKGLLHLPLDAAGSTTGTKPAFKGPSHTAFSMRENPTAGDHRLDFVRDSAPQTPELILRQPWEGFRESEEHLRFGPGRCHTARCPTRDRRSTRVFNTKGMSLEWK